ncbi:PREDICTED: chymotrypsin-2-like [Dufourea novaeangliae]|uniref:chymotrypsin-2-like n=1 Tax=Dufourea novaeangliae TaxID=178035 RepID=UPI000767371A|nr:PREDICTED: chymotrypsin-2-like [Dufourea novaeangliae]
MSLNLISFLALGSIVCANAASDAPGAQDSELGWFPYVVSLRINNGHLCTGSIVDNMHILTAAHCLYSHLNSPNDVVVVTSTILLDQGGESHRIAAMFVPEGYPADPAQDIGVVKLLDRIDDGPFQRSIPISDLRPPGDQYALMAGWGEIPTPIPHMSNSQQYLYVWMIQTSKCQEYYDMITTQICSSTEQNIGVCPGYSGSPLVYEDKVVGVASRGFCAIGKPDIFISVHDNMDFVFHALQQ